MKNYIFQSVILFFMLVSCAKHKEIVKSKTGDSITEQVNFTDSMGLKQGKWIDTTDYFIKKAHYKNDTLNGQFALYKKESGDLFSKGNYKHGKEVGTWFSYSDGSINSKLEVQPNVDSLKVKQVWGEWTPKYRSYFRGYYPKTKQLHQEGYLFYDENWESDGREDGKWIIYDETGRVDKELYYHNTEMVKEKWCIYDKSGKLIKERYFENGKVLKDMKYIYNAEGTLIDEQTIIRK